jgi:hypothetical protein
MFNVLIFYWDPICGYNGKKEILANNAPLTEQEADQMILDLPIEPAYRGIGSAIHSIRKQVIEENQS